MSPLTAPPFSKLEFIQIEDPIWYLRAGNHQIVACSVPSYSRRRDAWRGFQRVEETLALGRWRKETDDENA
jgi:hypothetical protein